jgi:serine/threonine protein kinase
MVSSSNHSLNIGLAPGTLLQGRYRATRELGRGPASVVYLAEDHHLGKEIALKVLALPANERARLRQEVMSAWDVVHDHIVPIRACFEAGERCCVVMDYVAGPDLAARLREAPLTVDEAAAVGRGIALGLQAAHRRGILHRQVKPSNILIGPEVRARLSDFGCAGFGPGDNTSGWDDYLAPEVLSGQPADGRADVYGLGLNLYYGLTGLLPGRQASGRPPLVVADGHRPSRLRPTVPPWLDDAIARATAALPADRFASAGRFADALAPGLKRAVGAVITVRA